MERGRRLFRARQRSRFQTAAMEMELFARLSDGQRVRANEHEGLGLAIRADTSELRVGEPLRLRLLYENLSAREAISATTCQGFSLVAEDESTAAATSAELRFGCPAVDVFRDSNVPLPHGQLRAVELNTADTKLTFGHPGRYLVVAVWQTFRPAEGMFPNGSEYAAVRSNEVLVTVR